MYIILYMLYKGYYNIIFLSCISVAMWGVQDKFLQLRIKLDNRLKIEKTTGALYRRWRWQQTQSNMEVCYSSAILYI